ncbi:alkene reductase [Bosea massiliensis]|uniref:Alkene reductase n=1 Tax=Bosea massiliensis TaxID=151419 RepID=A0ABW0P668_9HYPH
MSPTLFSPLRLGNIHLRNRVVMAPMTRNRADEAGVPTDLMVEYYRQRSTAGLIIAESSPISAQGTGYPFTPGIYTESQASGWKKIVEAVHAEGGIIFLQLQHCGRISHPDYQPNSAAPVAPSKILPSGQVYTYSGLKDFVPPRPLELSEIPSVISQFECAARFARIAGFDGIEVHGANGYLIDQFLRDGTNLRSDAYGGNQQGRMRLLNEVLDAVIPIWGAEAVGVRLSPQNAFNSMSDSDPMGHFCYFTEQLSNRALGYLHILEGDMSGSVEPLDYSEIRSRYRGNYIANNGYSKISAENAIKNGRADLVAFGSPFIANPDLIHRFIENIPLSEPNSDYFYMGGASGYVDYESAPAP